MAGEEAKAGLLKSVLSKVGGKGLAAGAAVVAPFAIDYLPGIVRGGRQTASEMLPGRSVTDRALDRMLEAQGQARDYQRYRARKEQELRRLQAVNTQRLATLAPHLFNQIMAGRELPEDAVVIGGQPRTDILQEITRQMSQGAFTPQEGV